jgi:hypothetical protein
LLEACPENPINKPNRDANKDNEVEEAAALTASLALQPVLGLAIRQLIAPPQVQVPIAADRDAVIAGLGIATTDSRFAPIHRLVELCHSIATDVSDPYGDRWPGLRRGAFLECLVEDLLGVRPRIVRREVRFTEGGWRSACQDIVGMPPDGAPPDPPFEVYECKSDPYDLEPSHIQDLAEIVSRTDHLGDTVAAVVTLQPSLDLDAALMGIEIPESPALWRVTLEDVLRLSVNRAAVRLAPVPSPAA